ncbi:MAG: anti-sigma factor antagonist [Bacteroidota bacterium]|nr:anti-sigma factor antagonist [Bacteroidota bacterium]
MFIVDKRVGNIKILELNGRIDTADEKFDEELKDVVKENNYVLLNCENLNYINSFGMRCFLSALKEIISHQGKMAICGLNENVKHVFKISGFLDQMNYADSYEEAMEFFK